MSKYIHKHATINDALGENISPTLIYCEENNQILAGGSAYPTDSPIIIQNQSNTLIIEHQFNCYTSDESVGAKYSHKDNMTWEEFVNSSYNDNNIFSIDADNFIVYDNTYTVQNDSPGVKVLKTDVITDNHYTIV